MTQALKGTAETSGTVANWSKACATAPTGRGRGIDVAAQGKVARQIAFHALQSSCGGTGIGSQTVDDGIALPGDRKRWVAA